MEQVLQLQNKLTFQQWRIAESLGWADADNINCIGHLVKYIDKTFSTFDDKRNVSIILGDPLFDANRGEPFYAVANQHELRVSRLYSDGRPFYSSNYSLLQASEDYQETLQKFICYLVKGKDCLVFCNVTKCPDSFDFQSKSIMTDCSAECDIFIPTSLCKGMSSRTRTAHITDKDVFRTIIGDYVKVMRTVHGKGYELNTHFYLTRAHEIKAIRENPSLVKEYWKTDVFRDYRKVHIDSAGEVQLSWRAVQKETENSDQDDNRY